MFQKWFLPLFALLLGNVTAIAQNVRISEAQPAILVLNNGAPYAGQVTSLDDTAVTFVSPGRPSRRYLWNAVLSVRTLEADYSFDATRKRALRTPGSSVKGPRLLGPAPGQVTLGDGTILAGTLFFLDADGCGLFSQTGGVTVHRTVKSSEVRSVRTGDKEYRPNRAGKLSLNGEDILPAGPGGTPTPSTNPQSPLTPPATPGISVPTLADLREPDPSVEEESSTMGRICGWFCLFILFGLMSYMIYGDVKSQEPGVAPDWRSDGVRLVLNLLSVAAVVALFMGLLGLLPMLWRTSRESVSIQELLGYGSSGQGTRGVNFLPDTQMRIRWLNPEAHQADLAQVQRLFANEAELQLVLKWGERLAQLWRDEYKRERDIQQQQYQPAVQQAAPGRPPPAPPARLVMLERILSVPMSQELSAHFAYRRLLAAPGARPEDLFRMRGLVAEAVPDAGERDELMAWVDTRIKQKDVTVEGGPESKKIRLLPPPDTTWFRDWMLYEDWCVTDAMFEARKKALMQAFGDERRFGRNVWRAFVSWGAGLAKERRRKGAFPRESERASVIAALDRIAYLDGSVDSLRAAFGKVANEENRLQGVALLLASPNDDVAMSQFGQLWDLPPRPTLQNDELLAPYRPTRSSNDVSSMARSHTLELLAFIALGAIFLLRGMQIVTLHAPGRLLGLENNSSFVAYKEHAGNPFQQVIILGAVIAVHYFVAGWFLDSYYVIHLRSSRQLLLAVAWNTLLGGVFVESVSNLVTVGWILGGKDPRRDWKDNVVTAGVTAFLLYGFQNNLISIFFSLVFGLAVSVLFKVRALKPA